MVDLSRLVALSPGDGVVSALVRQMCAEAVGLPALPSVSVGSVTAGGPVAEFAEQFSVDVSLVTEEQRSALREALGDKTFSAVVLMYIADWVPRVRVGLEAVGVGSEYLEWVDSAIAWDHDSEPSAVVFDEFLPAVARRRDLDPLLSELVRLRGAAAHNCRLCKSLREENALDAGGSETLYDEVSRFEQSDLLDGRAKTALRYADALIWSPAHLAVDDAAEVRSRFSEVEAVELTLDIMRNASNKVAVALGGDAARVDSGTERYLIDVDGQTVFS